MLISIEEDLVTLKNYLQSRGYQVANADKGTIGDVYIYSQTRMSLGQINSSVLPAADGSLVINIDRMSLDDIEYVLSHRTYTPIFD